MDAKREDEADGGAGGSDGHGGGGDDDEGIGSAGLVAASHGELQACVEEQDPKDPDRKSFQEAYDGASKKQAQEELQGAQEDYGCSATGPESPLSGQATGAVARGHGTEPAAHQIH